jgi:hypothetical protein
VVAYRRGAAAVAPGSHGPDGPATWVRIGVNYLVPFLVASYGFLSARRVPPAAG